MTDEQIDSWVVRGNYDSDTDRVSMRFGDPEVGACVGAFFARVHAFDLELRARPDGRIVELFVNSASWSMPAAALNETSVVEYAMQCDGSIWLGFFEGAGAVQRTNEELRLTNCGTSVFVGMNGNGKVVSLQFPDAINTLEGVSPDMERPQRPGTAFGVWKPVGGGAATVWPASSVSPVDWSLSSGYDPQEDTLQINLGDWEPDGREDVIRTTVDVFGHDVDFFQATDGRLFRVDIPRARYATPPKVWRDGEKFEARLDDDGSFHIGMFVGSFPLAANHQSVRDERRKLHLDVSVNKTRQVIGFRILSPRAQLANGHLL